MGPGRRHVRGALLRRVLLDGLPDSPHGARSVRHLPGIGTYHGRRCDRVHARGRRHRADAAIHVSGARIAAVVAPVRRRDRVDRTAARASGAPMTTVLLAGGGTGGHLMPALALAEATRTLRPDWRFVFAGAERGIEATVLAERGVPYHLLPLQPLYRRQWWKNLGWPLLLPSLLRRIDAMLQQERPAAVIGTGGYVSGPVVWRAARRRIPTGILELDV